MLNLDWTRAFMQEILFLTFLDFLPKITIFTPKWQKMMKIAEIPKH